MRLVLLSGGSGKRLWPLSNDVNSKQFLKVLENKNGGLESMVQRIWRQLAAVNLTENAVIATSISQVDMIQSQLGEAVRIVVEPERRNTYPAIALAAAYLFSEQNVDVDEVVVVLPVDAYVENAFFQRVAELEKVILTTNAELALVGVTPTYPSEKFGYIVPWPQQEKLQPIRVSHFCEKPTEERAKDLIAEQALWNCGVFAFRLGYIISKLKFLGLPLDYRELKKCYNQLPRISFDYEVVEKAENVRALSYAGYWKDLGTWNTLTEEIANPIMGKGKLSADSVNTHIINNLDIPVVVLGVSNAVIVASPDGILLADKQESPRLKDLVEDFTQRPMYEERRWGWYRVLDHVKYDDGQEVLTKRIGISAGKNLSYQAHNKRREVWTITKGEGEFVLNSVIQRIEAGAVLNIPTGAKHGIKAVTDLEFIEVQAGTELVEEDIHRIYLTWEEIEKHCQHAKG